MKKAMVFSTIVKAVLVMVVLFVLITILWGKVSWFNKNVDTCDSKGGKCSGDGLCGEDELLLFTKDCSYIGDKKEGLGQCCVPT